MDFHRRRNAAARDIALASRARAVAFGRQYLFEPRRGHRRCVARPRSHLFAGHRRFSFGWRRVGGCGWSGLDGSKRWPRTVPALVGSRCGFLSDAEKPMLGGRVWRSRVPPSRSGGVPAAVEVRDGQLCVPPLHQPSAGHSPVNGGGTTRDHNMDELTINAATLGDRRIWLCSVGERRRGCGVDAARTGVATSAWDFVKEIGR